MPQSKLHSNFKQQSVVFVFNIDSFIITSSRFHSFKLTIS